MTRLNTHTLVDLSKDEIELVVAATGNRLRFENRRKKVVNNNGHLVEMRVRTPVIINSQYLKVDTLIDTDVGKMTLMDYWKSGHKKLRCQSTFRDSSSTNGILNLHNDFAPFLFDNGTRIKFVLPPDELQRHMPDAWIGRLIGLDKEEILGRWTEALRSMEALARRKVLEWVYKNTDADKKELNAALKAAQDVWAKQANKSANDNMISGIEAEGRTPVMYDASKLPEILRQVERAVFEDRLNDLVLTHTQGLVTVREKRPTTVREVARESQVECDDAPLGLLIDRYEQHGLGIRLMASCAFLQENKAGRITEILAPSKLVHTMLETSHNHAAALVGIIEHPAVKEDGGLVSGEGFDQNTGFYTRVPKALVPDLPEIITAVMAAASYSWIAEEALADFPFATDLDRAGAVAMLLTTIQRRLMIGSEGAPMFSMSAPVQSSGKTALARVNSHLVHGVGLPVTSWPNNDEEMGKHLLGILMEGVSIVLFDNLPEGGRIESDELAKASTADKYRRRILGENREGEAPTNVVWLFTGNNIQPVGDFNTRTIQIYLDAGCESPDRRTFTRDDIETWCLDHRPEFFYHALTILAGYRRHVCSQQQTSGKTANCEPTRFKDWDQQVREPMVWAGAPDPAELFEQNKAEDPQKVGREVLLEAWRNVYGSEPQQLKKVLLDADQVGHIACRARLSDAISDLVPINRLTSKSLSTLLQKFQNQWIGDFRIRKAPQSENSRSAAKWYVECRVKDDEQPMAKTRRTAVTPLTVLAAEGVEGVKRGNSSL